MKILINDEISTQEIQIFKSMIFRKAIEMGTENSFNIEPINIEF